MSIETMEAIYDRINDPKKRAYFQVAVMKLMLGDRPEHMTDNEWINKELRFAEVYAGSKGSKGGEGLISRVIDYKTKDSEKIRGLIFSGKYEEAAKEFVEMMKVAA